MTTPTLPAAIPFYERTTLPNGLRVLTSTMPATRSVSVTIYVGAGSRYEREDEAGISHFVEHMLFKGTEKRPTAKEIAEAVDGVGGVLNGATDREYTVYYIKVARPHMDIALDVLIELVRHPLIEPAEIEKERGVVIEELAAVADSPPRWPTSSSTRSSGPTTPSAATSPAPPSPSTPSTATIILGYHAEQYVPNNIVISVAGNVTHDEVVDAVDAALGDWPSGNPAAWLPAVSQTAPAPASSSRPPSRPTSPSPSAASPSTTPTATPSRSSPSSSARACPPASSSSCGRSAASSTTSTATPRTSSTPAPSTSTPASTPRTPPRPSPSSSHELGRLGAEGPTVEELTKARELSKGRLLLRMEDSRAVSGWIGAQELLLSSVRTVEDAIDEMESVTIEDLQRVAREIIDPASAYLAVVGPFRSPKRFTSLLPG